MTRSWARGTLSVTIDRAALQWPVDQPLWEDVKLQVNCCSLRLGFYLFLRPPSGAATAGWPPWPVCSATAKMRPYPQHIRASTVGTRLSIGSQASSLWPAVWSRLWLWRVKSILEALLWALLTCVDYPSLDIWIWPFSLLPLLQLHHQHLQWKAVCMYVYH